MWTKCCSSITAPVAWLRAAQRCWVVVQCAAYRISAKSSRKYWMRWSPIVKVSTELASTATSERSFKSFFFIWFCSCIDRSIYRARTPITAGYACHVRGRHIRWQFIVSRRNTGCGVAQLGKGSHVPIGRVGCHHWHARQHQSQFAWIVHRELCVRFQFGAIFILSDHATEAQYSIGQRIHHEIGANLPRGLALLFVHRNSCRLHQRSDQIQFSASGLFG